MNDPFDALLVLSFGGPERPEDVMPFLRNVTAGRNVPDERLAVVAEQYQAFGGRSPINDQCRDLITAVETELASADIDLPVYWGNRNWEPYLADAVTAMAHDGINNALVFVTSAFGSYSGCRQYRENMERAREVVGARAPKLTKLRLFYNHPGFIEPMADNLRRAVDACDRGRIRVLFTAHSIPQSMADGCDYVAQLKEAASEVMSTAGLSDIGSDIGHDIVYQSRSGPPAVPWLAPDINDHLTELASGPTETAVVVPIGFISDHMEVLFDLDTQVASTTEDLSLDFVRVATVGTDRRFVQMLVELVEERRSNRPRLFVGPSGPWPDECPAGHCPAPSRPSAR